MLPITIGAASYFISRHIPINKLIRNYFADGLWAYALMSLILIIWDRSVNLFWVVIVFLFFVAVEILQYKHVIPGVGDSVDVFVYFIFSSLSFVSNKYFKTKN